MLEFKKYQHLEKLGYSGAANILEGLCYVFPKIDGTNGSVWYCHKNGVQAGSRNRQLTLDNDNAGFYNHVSQCNKIKSFLSENPNLRLYGEWLVPHSLKTYKDNKWRQFYVFDVMNEKDEHLPYEQYKELLDKHEVEYIPPLFKVKNPTEERIIKALDINDYLIKDDSGVGEGIVVKNYDFVNKFGRTTWAKLVTSEFKEKHKKAMGCSEVIEKQRVEEEIANEFITTALVEKTYAKIELEVGSFNGKQIPRLLETVFHDLITEDLWQILKKYNNPTIDFKALKRFSTTQIKSLKPEIF